MATAVHRVLRVSPHSVTSNSVESTLPLTFFETFCLKFTPVERIFFYRVSDLTHHIFNSNILPKLKHTLSLTLLHYPPLAGQIKWPPQDPQPSIFYSSTDGVSVTIAESDADFDSLSSKHVQEAINMRPLVPDLPISHDSAELISIQITLFSNKGFSIGISTHHAILDGKSSTTFVKSWAYLCKSQQPNLPPELTPSFDRTVINDPEGTISLYFLKLFGLGGAHPNSRSLKPFPTLGTPQNSVRAKFDLTRDDLRRLMDKVSEYQAKESKKKIHLSTFVVTCAYVFTCMITTSGGDADRDVIIILSADYRVRSKPPIPSNYLGNCVGPQRLFAKAGEFTEEDGVCVAADKLSELVKGLEKNGAVEGLEEMFGVLKTYKAGTQALCTAGSNRFGVYESDFGWGRPEMVEVVSIDGTGAVSLAESREGDGGVEVGLVLEKQEMEAFVSLFHQGLGRV